MRTAVKRVLSDERGAAFALTLVLLLVGGLVIPPLLGFMFGGLIQGDVYERRARELYAADAGVEDALWKIHQGEIPVCPAAPHYSYPMQDPVNGNNVTIDIKYGSDANDVPYYQILSTATRDGSGTEVEAYAVSVYGNYTDITDHVLTSQAGISYPPKPILNYPEGHEPNEYYDGPWPELDTLYEWYLHDVEGVAPYGSGTIDLAGGNLNLGPVFREGPLEILNSSNTPTTLTLTGTIYITGDTLIGKNGKDFTLDLNGHAIFVESSSADPQKALWIGGKCSIIGPGVIAAVGDIYFEPNIPAGMTDPIFIISVEGTTTLQPGGDFYGAIAGSVEIDLQPGSSVTYPEDGFPSDLNWPGFDLPKYKYAIDSWTVTTL